GPPAVRPPGPAGYGGRPPGRGTRGRVGQVPHDPLPDPLRRRRRQIHDVGRPGRGHHAGHRAQFVPAPPALREVPQGALVTVGGVPQRQLHQARLFDVGHRALLVLVFADGAPRPAPPRGPVPPRRPHQDPAGTAVTIRLDR